MAEITPEVAQRMRDMLHAAWQIAATLGENSEESVRAFRTLANVLVWTADAERLWCDGDLGLGGVTSYGVTFGVVPFRRRVPLGETTEVVVVEWSVHT